MESKLDLKMVNGNVELATMQVLDMDSFVKRIVNMSIQKENMLMQNENMRQQNENNNKAIEKTLENVKMIDSDMAKVEQFLKANHKHDLFEKAMNEVKKLKEDYEASQKNAPQPMNQ